MRFWISWYEKTDSRPAIWPIEDEIVGSWCSGYDLDNNPIMVALVDASDKEAAAALINTHWPGAYNDDWRFFNEVADDYLPSGGRFIVDPERLEKLKNKHGQPQT